MRRKEALIANLWDLRSQFEEGMRALTAAQRAVQSWNPGESASEDKRARTRIRDCFATLTRDNQAVATTLNDITNDLVRWSQQSFKDTHQ